MNAKLTRNQRQVYEALKAAKQELTAQELHQQLRGATQKIGLSTVYRTLKVLQIQGKVQARTRCNGEAVYQLTQTEHHHLTCLNCGYSVPVNSCPVKALEQELAESQQFQIYYHTLEFFGVCSSCANQLGLLAFRCKI
ncbi:MAG: transcriptional repressor [Merismopedia sp. SIO2A8]|nr:transcriptional repressor [Symploca sp. SIO2B6]NET53964.1 transcriptional repressor [Merismopedia sp. SIO2A8]